MRGFLTTVAVLLGVLALSGCGSGRQVAFTQHAKVGSLSIPMPAGFRSRTWPRGVVIYDGSGKIPIPCTTNNGCADGVAGYPNRDELVVYETMFHETPPKLGLPLALQSLQRMSARLPEWDGAGSIDRAGIYAVDVWLGPKAPAGDRAAILSALQTVKPR